MADQFDVSAEQRKILEEKAKRRAFLRNEFLKQKTDPFAHASGHGGFVFDSAYQRYTALKVNHFEFFKPTAKNALTGLVILVIPMVTYGYFLNKSRNDLEKKYRNGEVAYKDRRFKFI